MTLMTDSNREPTRSNAPDDEHKKGSISMHENVPAWYDCCSCEAEPHWLAVAEELGIDACENSGNGLEAGTCDD